MPAAPRSTRAPRLPADQLSGSLSWARFNQHKARPFAAAWDSAGRIQRVVVCRLVGVAELNATRAWAEIPGDIQCYMLARYFVLTRELQGFADLIEADAL